MGGIDIIKYHNWLVVSNMTGLFSISYIWDVILPIDELIFFKMVIAPPTRYNFIKSQKRDGLQGLMVYQRFAW